uniref:NIPSNAP domain-containing protein n=1 Tax=Xiphophorus couchianus TaxID=32473 RepID=A0A3B5M590_9TELE
PAAIRTLNFSLGRKPGRSAAAQCSRAPQPEQLVSLTATPASAVPNTRCSPLGSAPFLFFFFWDFMRRSSSGKSSSWNSMKESEYICKALPLLTAQDNEVSYLVPWSRLKSPPQQGGVFELATFRMRPGGPAVWGGAFQAAMSAHDAPGYGKLLGAFHSEFGLLNRVHALWWFESADHRAECRHKAHTDARVVAAVRNSVAHLDSQRNQLMFPCTFSPMK